MNIKLIGTGGIYSKYNSASTLIDESLIVDVPNGALKQLLNLNCVPEKIDKILITHMHGDHTADIPFLLMYLYKGKNINRKTTIIGPIGIEQKVEELFNAYNYHFFNSKREVLDFIELKPNEILNNANIDYTINAIPVLHGNEKNAYGYVLNKVLGFTGDSSLCEGVEYIVNNSNIVISDCSNINGNGSHMGIDNMKYLTEKYNKKLITTHMKDETREELSRLEISNIIIGKDGYQFNI